MTIYKSLLSTFLLLTILFCACNNKIKSADDYPFIFEGMIEKSGITSYMYGTHTISNNGEMYALKSSNRSLDSFVNRVVVIKGSKMASYPVDAGPEYIDVAVIEAKR